MIYELKNALTEERYLLVQLIGNITRVDFEQRQRHTTSLTAFERRIHAEELHWEPIDYDEYKADDSTKIEQWGEEDTYIAREAIHGVAV